MDRILPQHIPETANRFEILTNLSTDIVKHKSENKSVKETSESASLRQRKYTYKEKAASEVVKYTGRIHLSKFQH